eukprot:PhM_4_TR17913/c0_g1_i1/m.10903
MDDSEYSGITDLVFDSLPHGFCLQVETNNKSNNIIEPSSTPTARRKTPQVFENVVVHILTHGITITRRSGRIVAEAPFKSVVDVKATPAELVLTCSGGEHTLRVLGSCVEDRYRFESLGRCIRHRCLEEDAVTDTVMDAASYHVRIVNDSATSPMSNKAPAGVDDSVMSVFTADGSTGGHEASPSRAFMSPHTARHSREHRQGVEEYDNVLKMLHGLLSDDGSTAQSGTVVRNIVADANKRDARHSSATPTSGGGATSYPHAFKTAMQLHPRTLVGQFRQLTACMDEPENLKAAGATLTLRQQQHLGGGKSADDSQTHRTDDGVVIPVGRERPTTRLRQTSMSSTMDALSPPTLRRHGSMHQQQQQQQQLVVGSAASEVLFGDVATTTGGGVLDFDKLLLPTIPLDDPMPAGGAGGSASASQPPKLSVSSVSGLRQRKSMMTPTSSKGIRSTS